LQRRDPGGDGETMKPSKSMLICTGMILVLAGSTRMAGAAGFCNVSSAGVAFSGYNVFGATPDDQQGTVTIMCGGNITPTNFTVMLDKGAHSNGLPNRSMKNGSNSDTLSYNLYFDASRTTVWGDGTSGTTDWVITGNSIKNPTFNQSIYGRITAGQTNASVGSYTDTVTMTLNY
jgi:spore coat protein U-like protein